MYAIKLGATTIWERWNSVLPDGSVSGNGMNSLNHYAYGSVTEFLYRHAAGICATEPGFRKVLIKPLPDNRLLHLECNFESIAERYISNWIIEKDGSLSFHFEIPFGCEATIVLPEQDEFTVSSGIYDYKIHTQKDYLALFTAKTPIERLLKNKDALSILKNMYRTMLKISIVQMRKRCRKV